MNKAQGIASFCAAVFVLLIFLAATTPAAASLVMEQGCAMCKLSAEAAGEDAARALDYGIFILLVPTITFFLGIFYWAFSHRDRSLADQMEDEEQPRIALPERPPQNPSV